MHIENGTDEVLKITEQDICLEAGKPGTIAWALSPVWRSDVDRSSLQIATINPKQAGEFELKWNDWVRQGFWYDYSTYPHMEAGPSLPDPEPGKISVRVWVRNHGVIPVALPDPSLLLGPPATKDDSGRTRKAQHLRKSLRPWTCRTPQRRRLLQIIQK